MIATQRSCLSFTLVLGLLSTGCATVIHGTSHRIIASSDIKSARIYHNNQFVGKGRTSVIIDSKGQHILEGKKRGCESNEVLIRKKTNAMAWILGNILLAGGIIGMFVDVVTGAYKSPADTFYDVTPLC